MYVFMGAGWSIEIQNSFSISKIFNILGRGDGWASEDYCCCYYLNGTTVGFHKPKLTLTSAVVRVFVVACGGGITPKASPPGKRSSIEHLPAVWI